MATEKRLIDANALLQFVDERNCGLWIYKHDFVWAVTKQPTVDAVEVVRRKDCKRYEENTEARTRFCRRELGYMYATPDGFCSYGERRNDENT